MNASAWTEVLVAVPEGWTELVAEVLSRPPCTSVAWGAPSLGTEPPPPGHEYVRTYVAARDDTPAWRDGLAASLAELGQIAEELADLPQRYREVPAEDWATSWRKSWRPFRVGRIAVVAPREHSGGRSGGRSGRADDVTLQLEPGGVFGTGRHATTRACLRALQSRLRPGERVLDAGSGTGILAVAAARLGAAQVFGFDVDPGSEPAANALAETNGVTERCTFATGGFELLDDAESAFDGVLANIYADVLCAELPRLALLLRPGGWFVLSGCHVDHLDETLGAVSAAGLELERHERRGRWCTLTGRRPTQ